LDTDLEFVQILIRHSPGWGGRGSAFFGQRQRAYCGLPWQRSFQPAGVTAATQFSTSGSAFFPDYRGSATFGQRHRTYRICPWQLSFRLVGRGSVFFGQRQRDYCGSWPRSFRPAGVAVAALLSASGIALIADVRGNSVFDWLGRSWQRIFLLAATRLLRITGAGQCSAGWGGRGSAVFDQRQRIFPDYRSSAIFGRKPCTATSRTGGRKPCKAELTRSSRITHEGCRDGPGAGVRRGRERGEQEQGHHNVEKKNKDSDETGSRMIGEVLLVMAWAWRLQL